MFDLSEEREQCWHLIHIGARITIKNPPGLASFVDLCWTMHCSLRLLLSKLTARHLVNTLGSFNVTVLLALWILTCGKSCFLFAPSCIRPFKLVLLVSLTQQPQHVIPIRDDKFQSRQKQQLKYS